MGAAPRNAVSVSTFFFFTLPRCCFLGIERRVSVPEACSDEISTSFFRHFGMSDWIRACVRSSVHVPLQHLFLGLTFRVFLEAGQRYVEETP